MGISCKEFRQNQPGLMVKRKLAGRKHFENKVIERENKVSLV
jgi:hypothetical protein